MSRCSRHMSKVSCLQAWLIVKNSVLRSRSLKKFMRCHEMLYKRYTISGTRSDFDTDTTSASKKSWWRFTIIVSRPGLDQSRVLSTKIKTAIGEFAKLASHQGFALFQFATLRSVLPKAFRWSIVELLGVHWITTSVHIHGSMRRFSLVHMSRNRQKYL